jgi:hypothetical protein
MPSKSAKKLVNRMVSHDKGHMCYDLENLEGRLLKEDRENEASAIRSLLMLVHALDTESQLRDEKSHQWMDYESLEGYAIGKWRAALAAWAKSENCTAEELVEELGRLNF